MNSWHNICSIRTLRLSPAGISCIQISDHVIPEITLVGPKAAPSTDQPGREWSIRLEVIAYIADQFPSAALVGVLGHRAHACCSHLSSRCLCLRRSSNYEFKNLIHSAPSAIRANWRTKTLLGAELISKNHKLSRNEERRPACTGGTRSTTSLELARSLR